jgi:hypothetical protein
VPHQCQAQLLKSQAEAVLRLITRLLEMAGPSESLLIKNFLNVHLHLFQMSLSLVCICWVGAVILQIVMGTNFQKLELYYYNHIDSHVCRIMSAFKPCVQDLEANEEDEDSEDDHSASDPMEPIFDHQLMIALSLDLSNFVFLS